MDTWTMIEAERTSLIDDLAQLPTERWEQPTLCAEWDTKTVVGHLIATTYTSPPKFFGRLIGNGFNFTKMIDGLARSTAAGQTPEALVTEYRSRVSSHTAPPAPKVTWLGETIIHGQDIFRAAGTYRATDTAHVTAVADFYKGSNMVVGAKSRIQGVTLRATDTEWSHGSGPEVSGPIIALLMAMVGRTAALDDLSGDGVAVLQGQMAR